MYLSYKIITKYLLPKLYTRTTLASIGKTIGLALWRELAVYGYT